VQRGQRHAAFNGAYNRIINDARLLKSLAVMGNAVADSIKILIGFFFQNAVDFFQRGFNILKIVQRMFKNMRATVKNTELDR